MASLSAQQVYAAARGAGATHDEAVLLTAIAKGESGWNTTAHFKPGNTTEDSYGIWQINMDPKYAAGRLKQFGISSATELYDPRVNARAAVLLLRSQGPGAWTLYKNGGYKQYLAEAQAAGSAVGDNWQSVARGLNKDTSSGAGEVLTNAPLTGRTGGGGGAGAPAGLPPNASPAEIEAYIRENYPQAAGFLEVPEIRDKLITAARESWTPTKLQAEIQSTQWWRTNSADVRSYFALKSTDPAQFKALIDQKASSLADEFAQTGAPGNLNQWAETALKYGWSDDQLRDEWAKHLQTQSSATGLTPGSTIDISADDLVRMARNEYLVPLGQQDAERWAIDIYAGRKTEAQIRDYLAKQSAARFPGLAESGFTPGEYLAPLRQVIAETLEVNPADIDFLDRKFSAVLEFDTGKGLRPMSISEAQKWARQQPGYRNTKGAQDIAAGFAEQLLTTFGGVA